LTIRSGMSSV